MTLDHVSLLSSHAGVGIPLAVGLVSASGFAVANSLQHRVAGTVPADVTRATAVLRHLARRPQWQVATTISFLAMVCHALALRLGSITLVQPLMLVGVVLAVPLRAALERERPPWAALRAVGTTTLGLAAFLAFADLHGADAAPRFAVAAALVGVGVVLAGAMALLGNGRLRPRAHAALLGTAAGVLFGLTAGLLKLVGTAFSHPGTPLLTRLLLVGGLVGAGLMGTAVNQRAYQIAPIAFSMPLVNVLDIVVALVFGSLVFQEVPGHDPTGLALQVVALGCVALGLRGIARLDVDEAAAATIRVEVAR
jgi:drug/metabolite transporter (DMT)-like permease